jgi:pyrroline-5-carboxylate reductase
MEAAIDLFSSLGRTAVLDENLMDAATGLSGCGPAYVFLIIEALAEAGVKLGIPRGTSTLLAAQTLLGASQLALQRDVHPAALKDEVTTPAGCTIDGLMALEDGRLRSTLISGVIAAANRSRELRAELPSG